jgi:hypothetical protein
VRSTYWSPVVDKGELIREVQPYSVLERRSSKLARPARWPVQLRRQDYYTSHFFRNARSKMRLGCDGVTGLRHHLAESPVLPFYDIS